MAIFKIEYYMKSGRTHTDEIEFETGKEAEDWVQSQLKGETVLITEMNGITRFKSECAEGYKIYAPEKQEWAVL